MRKKELEACIREICYKLIKQETLLRDQMEFNWILLHRIEKLEEDSFTPATREEEYMEAKG